MTLDEQARKISIDAAGWHKCEDRDCTLLDSIKDALLSFASEQTQAKGAEIARLNSKMIQMEKDHMEAMS